MIYLDSSVALAHLLKQDRRPPKAFWLQPITSSRLLEYEVWNRLHVYAAGSLTRDRARSILRRIGLQDMTRHALDRALEPFPLPIRTLDGLHLATMDNLRKQGIVTTLASYDVRLLAAAGALGFNTVQP